MKRIGFLGAYSIDNAGDALLGLATRQALRALLPDAAQHRFERFAPVLPGPQWGHDFGPGRGLDGPITPVPAGEGLDWARGLDALVIGGGGILSPDPAFRPFLLGGDGGAGLEVPAAWNAICSQGQAWYLSEYAAGYQAVRRCCEALRYVSVRNRTSERFVRGCGFHGPVHVVPDAALLLDLSAQGAATVAIDLEVDQALSEAGLATDPRGAGHRLVGLSVGRAIEDPRAAAFFRDLLAALEAAHAGPVPTEIVLFPFGGIYGDAALQELAALAMPRANARVLRRRLSAPALWRLVGRLDLYVATRLHAVLAAFAQDVPFLALDEYLSDDVASSKIREFIVDAGLEPLYLCPLLSTAPSWKLRAVLNNLPAISIQAGMARARMNERLRGHYRALAHALGLIE